MLNAAGDAGGGIGEGSVEVEEEVHGGYFAVEETHFPGAATAGTTNLRAQMLR